MPVRSPAEIEAEIVRRAGRGVASASYFLQARLKEVLSVPAPRKRVRSASGVVYYRATTPALPGAPPRKLSGRLRASIAVEMVSTSDGLVGRIGTNVFYGRVHEEGLHQWLVPTMRKYRSAIYRIVIGEIRRSG